jgi:ABC-2 type transport system permease protein
MGRVMSIARREMQSYFNSPVAYVVLGVFLLIIGYLYFSTLFLTGFASLRNFFSVTPVLLVVFAPALTMRLIAEERKSGTIEHLLTLPVSDVEVVIGKFLAAVGTLCVGLLITLPYPVSVGMLAPRGLSMDWGPVVGGYLGLILLSSTFLSLGLFSSSLTRNQIVAFIIGLLMCFFFFFIDKFAILMPATFAPLFEFLSVDYHFGNIARGVVDSRDILFYTSLTSIALMLTVFSIRLRKN